MALQRFIVCFLTLFIATGCGFLRLQFANLGVSESSTNGGSGGGGSTPPPTPIIESAPLAILIKTPIDPTHFEVSVGGSDIVAYRYKVEDASGTGCQSSIGYSGDIDSITNISVDLNNFSIGSVILCVLGKNSQGAYQPLVSPSSTSWTISSPVVGFAILTNYPSSPSSLNDLDVVVDSSDVTEYQYKLVSGSVVDCSDPTGYSSWISNMAIHITDSIYNFDDGLVTICARGRDFLGGEQPLASATQVSWFRDAPAEVQFSRISQYIDEDSAGPVTFELKLNHRKSSDVVIDYDVLGTAILGVDHNLMKGQITIPANSLTQTKSFSLIGNTHANTPELQISAVITDIPSVNAFVGIGSWHNIVLRDNETPPTRTILTMTYGRRHGCVIYTDNQLFCWGYNSSGQLGIGNLIATEVPTLVGGNSFKFVEAGTSSTCAINLSNRLYCWGDNSSGQLGRGNTTSSSIPVAIDATETYESVSTGDTHTCAITTAHKLKCWGSNGGGQVGDGTFVQKNSPIGIDASNDYSFVTVGTNVSCAIRTDKKLFCWGENANAYHGLGFSLGNQNTPMASDPTENYKFVSVAYFGGCAITDTDDLKCWGYNYAGESGPWDFGTFEYPTLIEPGIKYKDVSMGIETIGYEPHTCGVTLAGELKCWGSDYNSGALGIGALVNYSESVVPTVVDSGVSYQKIFAGTYTTCGWMADGNIKCWGLGNLGGLDYKSIPFVQPLKISPTVVPTQFQVSKVSKGDIGCIITTNKELYCLGFNTKGLDRNNFTRRDRQELYDKVAVFEDNSNTACGLTDSGVLKCWDQIFYDPTVVAGASGFSRSESVVMTPGQSYKDFSVGYQYTCGITTNDDLTCWGANSWGQLGVGYTSGGGDPLSSVDPGVKYKKIFGGRIHTCGITMGDIAKCWGYNADGQLGDNSTTNRLLPTPINDVDTYQSLSPGSYHTCGITTSGKLKCWGKQTSGALGNGVNSSATVNSPIEIDVGVQYTKVEGYLIGSCGITASKILKCWGDGSSLVPTQRIPGELFNDVSVRGARFCAVTDTGKLYCWGVDRVIDSQHLPLLPNPFLPALIPGILKL